MSTLEKTVKEALKKEAKKRANQGDLNELARLLVELRSIQGHGLLKQQDYTIAPLDTIGRRRFQFKK